MAGDIVAKLGVDSSQWASGFAKARGDVTSFAGAAKKAYGSLDGIVIKKWKDDLGQAKVAQGSFVNSVVRGFAPIGIALAGAFGVKTSVAAFQESLTQSRKLNSVLAATGGAAGLTGAQISDFAADLQKVTNFEDDATVGAAALLASFTNIRGDVFKDAIKSAADMTTILGGDLQGNVRLLGKALNDPTNGLAKLSKAGVSFTDQQKKQIETMQESGNVLGAQGIILKAMSEKFGGAAEASAEPLKQLQNTIGDVAENIGALMLPALSVGATTLSDFLGVVVGGGDAFKDFGIEAAVQLSHITGLFQLTSLNWSIALIEFLPQGQGIFQTLGAFINATFKASTVAAGLFIENVIDGFTEFRNISVAVFDSIWAGLEALISMENPFAAMSAAFSETMESMVSPDKAQGWASGFAETFAKTYQASMQGFSEGGGMLKGMKAERDALTASLGASMNEQKKVLQEKFSPNKVIPGAGTQPLDDFSKDDKEKKAKTEKEKTVKDSAGDVKAALIGTSEAASIATRGFGAGKLKLDTFDALSLAEEKRITAAINKAAAEAKAKREAKPLFFDQPKPAAIVPPEKPKPGDEWKKLVDDPAQWKPVELQPRPESKGPLRKGDPGFDAAVERSNKFLADIKAADQASQDALLEPIDVFGRMDSKGEWKQDNLQMPRDYAPQSPELRPVQLPQRAAGVSRNSETKSLEAILKQQLAEQKKTTSAVAKTIPQKMTMAIV